MITTGTVAESISPLMDKQVAVAVQKVKDQLVESFKNEIGNILKEELDRQFKLLEVRTENDLLDNMVRVRVLILQKLVSKETIGKEVTVDA